MVLCQRGGRLGCVRLFKECPEYVVAVGVEQEKQEESHDYVLGGDKNIFGNFSPGDDFSQQEHDVAAVESGDGYYVHECESHREECGDLPEREPVPAVGKHVAYCAESAYALCAF